MNNSGAGPDGKLLADPAMTDEKTNKMDIPSSDIIRLILTHLTESGLHSSCRALREESGVGMAGILTTTKGRLIGCAEEGKWGEVLEILDCLDLERDRKIYIADFRKAREREDREASANDDNYLRSIVTPLEKTVAMVHEMAILELADCGEVDLALATLQACGEFLDRALSPHDEPDEADFYGNHDHSRLDKEGKDRSRTIERRVTELASLRSTTGSANTSSTPDAPGSWDKQLLPVNFYGQSNLSRQKRRNQICKLLKRDVPEVPVQRLSSLLQQSVRWQCFTGVFPTIRRLFQQSDDHDENDQNRGLQDGNDNDDKNNIKGKKKKRNRKQSVEQRFDLILGNVDVYGEAGMKKKKKSSSISGDTYETIPSRPSQTIRMGKKSFVETAIFLPDGKGLVTGSSDGFVEIWGEPKVSESKTSTETDSFIKVNEKIDFEKLRTHDLPYQRNDDLIMHDSPILAMDVTRDGTMLGTASSDGTVCVWKIMDGKLLRKINRAHGGAACGDAGNSISSGRGAAVTCIHFSADGSKILTGGHDSTCREFGLLASRMLKEFRGHQSYVNCCEYVIVPYANMMGSGDSHHRHGHEQFLIVVTGSADGTVRVWNGRTAEPMREIKPPTLSPTSGSGHESDSMIGSRSIHTLIHLHSPPQTMVVIPRSDRAYLMSYSGALLRTYTRDDVQGVDFTVGTVSPGNQWLYLVGEDGKCTVFDLRTGKLEKILSSFAENCSGRSDTVCEISGLIHHPHRGSLGGYSNDKGQKRGLLTLWK